MIPEGKTNNSPSLLTSDDCTRLLWLTSGRREATQKSWRNGLTAFAPSGMIAALWVIIFYKASQLCCFSVWQSSFFRVFSYGVGRCCKAYLTFLLIKRTGEFLSMCINCFSLPHECEISMLCSSFYALSRSQHHPPSLQADWLQMRSGLPVNGQVTPITLCFSWEWCIIIRVSSRQKTNAVSQMSLHKRDKNEVVQPDLKKPVKQRVCCIC